MKLQDKLSLSISLLALLVSIGTTTYEKLSARKEEARRDSKKLYAAFYLGESVIHAYVWKTQVVPQNQAESDEAKREVLYQLSNAQGLADSLDLRLNVREVFESSDPARSADRFNNRMFSSGQERLKAIISNRAAAAYDLGAWLLWAYFESKIVAGDSPKERELLQMYPKVRDHINSDLDELGETDKMPETVRTVAAIETSSTRLKKHFEEKWTH